MTSEDGGQWSSNFNSFHVVVIPLFENNVLKFVDNSEQIWTNPDVYGRIWTNPDESGRIRTNPDEYERFKIISDDFWRFRTVLDNFDNFNRTGCLFAIFLYNSKICNSQPNLTKLGSFQSWITEIFRQLDRIIKIWFLPLSVLNF